MSDKIKLDDMTIRQLRELKEGYQIRVAEALTAIQKEFMEKYDCGYPLVRVTTEVKSDVVKSTSGMFQYSKVWCEHGIQIKFSKEDD